MSYHRKNRDKTCRLYARTGQCSFGDVCKYTHERGGSFKPPASFEDRIWSHSQVNVRAVSPANPCVCCERRSVKPIAAQLISGNRFTLKCWHIARGIRNCKSWIPQHLPGCPLSLRPICLFKGDHLRQGKRQHPYRSNHFNLPHACIWNVISWRFNVKELSD